MCFYSNQQIVKLIEASFCRISCTWLVESITLQQKTAYINTKLSGFLSKRSRRN